MNLRRDTNKSEFNTFDLKYLVEMLYYCLCNRSITSILFRRSETLEDVIKV